MTSAIIRSLGLVVLGLLMLSASGCCGIEDEGNVYACSCTRRCQGVTTQTSASPCAASSGEAASSAEGSCSTGCTPEAACTCTCTQTIEKCLSARRGCR